jgi:hypothetical protein
MVARSSNAPFLADFLRDRQSGVHCGLGVIILIGYRSDGGLPGMYFASDTFFIANTIGSAVAAPVSIG